MVRSIYIFHILQIELGGCRAFLERFLISSKAVSFLSLVSFWYWRRERFMFRGLRRVLFKEVAIGRRRGDI
jgi:hypothetical protein